MDNKITIAFMKYLEETEATVVALDINEHKGIGTATVKDDTGDFIDLKYKADYNKWG